MPVRTIEANAHVKDDLGRIAIERGPLVYCVEGADNQFDIFSFVISNQPEFKVEPFTLNAQSAPLKAITARGQVVGRSSDGQLKLDDVRLKMIPYYAWNHRGAGKMDVWLLHDIAKFSR
jgi:DUF1680 family protein